MKLMRLLIVINASVWLGILFVFAVAADGSLNMLNRSNYRTLELNTSTKCDCNESTQINTTTRQIYFGVLLPTSNTPPQIGHNVNETVRAAIDLAVQHVCNTRQLIPDCGGLRIEYGDTQCSSIFGPLLAFEMYSKQKKPDAFFGPMCDYVLAPVARYAGIWKVPVLAAGGMAAAFDFKASYPTLTRITGSYGDASAAILHILGTFQWNQVALLYYNYDLKQERGNSDCSFTLKNIFQETNTSYQQAFNEMTATRLEFLRSLQQIKTKARIVIMCANHETIREIMLAAQEIGMIDSGEYVFINVELFTSKSDIAIRPWYNPNDTTENNERAQQAYTALLTVTTRQPVDNEYLHFSEKVKQLASAKYNYTFSNNEPVSTFVTAFYDAILLYAYALNDSISEADGDSGFYAPLNGTRITELMWNRSFRGITGNVTINYNGDRVSDYTLLDMNPVTGNFEIVANFFHASGLKNVKPIHWPGGRMTPPLDKPVCGFDGSLCEDKSLPIYAILSIALGIMVIVMLIVLFFVYKHYKLEAEINSMSWKVNWNDVVLCNATGNRHGSMHSLSGRRDSQLPAADYVDTLMYSEDLISLGEDKQIFITVGVFKGCKVAIKQIGEKNLNINRQLMLELKKMKDLHHEHLVRFYGACVDVPNSCILTEYCPKGSLQDLLEDDRISLDWMFKLSLMHDIVKGMSFLHSVGWTHGNLKSSNCVVDSRFVLKITDFGLHHLRNCDGTDDKANNQNSYAYWRNLLWTGPELLKLDSVQPEGTIKGDVYAFGIIMHEIVLRKGPFYTGGSCDLHPKEIVLSVKEGPSVRFNILQRRSSNVMAQVPFRPRICDDPDSLDEVNRLMEKCWSEDPMERPEFSILKTTIRKINRDNETGNIVDNLLKRMEQYANNLEGLVDERTRDYLEEKRKCENVLYQLLPKSVAAQLIKGQPVLAETFEQVTIYFSDIVGFTSISASSTPMQVVDFLNDLYTCFDSVVGNYDVYKVETIGDAYMVVSGLPERNGDLHAREIARLALSLLQLVFRFRIRHRPDDQLRLRIGLHSGPCVAGVVGLTMPRYCLFGDTVNTASRMESNGEALKIHMSSTTKEILDRFPTFKTQERGLIDIKGKGKMRTYWLTHEEPANGDVPTTMLPPMVNGEGPGRYGGSSDGGKNGETFSQMPNQLLLVNGESHFGKLDDGNGIKGNLDICYSDLGTNNVMHHRVVTMPTTISDQVKPNKLHHFVDNFESESSCMKPLLMK